MCYWVSFFSFATCLLVGYICLTTTTPPLNPACPAQLLSAFPYLISRDLLPFKRALVLLHNSLKYESSKTQTLTKTPRSDMMASFIGVSNVELHPSSLMRRAAGRTIAIGVSFRRGSGIVETPICNHSLINITITIIFRHSSSV